MFHPKLFSTLRDYSLQQFMRDSIAGVIVGIVAIPLAIAFAIASGVSPDRGLATAVVAGFLISALGGSRVQIGGPTGAFVVIVYGIVQKYGIEGLIAATFLAGIMLIIMGCVRLGSVIKFIPHSVIVGFTSGIAVIIFTSQIPDMLGLPAGSLPADFLAKWGAIAGRIGQGSVAALCVSIFTIVLVALWPRVSRRVPGALVAIIVTSIAVALLKLPVETIGARFGSLPAMLPMPKLPHFDPRMAQDLFHAALAIAVLGAIESLLSAVIADGMIGGKHRSNTELIAQGFANIGSALFGGMPATGAVARTVTNVRNGGRTPVAGIVHAATIAVLLFFFGRFIGFVPLACLGGILAVVAYHMSEWRSFSELVRSSRGACGVVLTTFAITVFIDLPTAIEVGVVLSAFIFIKRMSDATEIRMIAREIADPETNGEGHPVKMPIPAGVQVYEVHGPLFFGAANRFDEVERELRDKPRVRILRFCDVPLIDSTGMHALRAFYDRCRKAGMHLIVTGLHVQPLNEMVKSNLYDLIGEENVFASMRESLARAEEVMKQ